MECEYLDVSPDGRVICTKIVTPTKTITKELCKTACPLPPPKRCAYIRFSLRRDEHFSALGLGGRIVRLTIDRAVCEKNKEPLLEVKACDTCRYFKISSPQKREEEDNILTQGLEVLKKSLGEEKTEEFIRLLKEGSPSKVEKSLSEEFEELERGSEDFT